jgi:hypothetical protein
MTHLLSCLASLALFLLLPASGLVVGCAAQQTILGQPVHRSVAIKLHISDEVNSADHAGGVAELVQAITDGLKDKGMDSDIYTADDDNPPPPRIELNVVYWSETTQLSRGLSATMGLVGKAIGPNNRMIVDCGVVLDPGERRVFWRRIQAGARLGGGPAAAGGNAGSQILHYILNR